MTVLDELIQELCPDGVKYKALGEICKLVTGATPSKTNAAYWENGTIPWMSSGEVNLKRVAATEKKITQLGYEKNSTTIVPKHSVVIALAGQGKTRGKVAITEIDLCTNQSLCSMICNENLDYKFLYYILDGKYEELRAISNGDGTRGGLSLKILAPYKIPVPPLPVQHEIVRILDNFTELTEEITEKLTAELTARKKQYEYYRDTLLTFGAHKEGTFETKWRTLGETCDILTGYPFDSAQFKKSGVRLMRGMNIKRGGLVFDESIDRYWESSRGLEKYLLDAGDIVISMDGSLVGKSFGTVAESDLPLLLVQRVARIRAVQANQRYVYHYISCKFPHYVELKKTKGAIPHISQKDISNFQIAIPDVEVQNKIAEVLDNFDAICSDLNIGLPAEIEARKKQYEYYRDMLLTFAAADDIILTDRQTDRQTEHN